MENQACAGECQNNDEPEHVRSYGIDIDRQKIRPVPEAEQSAALKNLGVSAYEQEEFEEGVLRQVDEAIEAQERRVAIKAAEKNLQNIQEEIKSTEDELEKAEKAIYACQGNATEDYYVRRSLGSLKSHRETKIKQLQRLQARKKYASKDLEDLLSKVNSNRGFDAQRHHGLLDLQNVGITDFDDSHDISSEFDDSRPSTSKDGLEKSLMLSNSFDNGDKYDRIKRKKRQIDIRDELSDSYSSEEEYIPYPDEVSDEITDEEFSEDHKATPFLVTLKKKKTGKLGPHHKTLKSKLKSQKPKSMKKVVDDGDINAYQQRIRELRLKERLQKSGSLDVISESDISEEEESDNKTIALKGGFALSVRMWRKLYKYQRTCVKWLWELHCQAVGGILGDEMGLGKTIQVIAFLTGLKNLESGFGPTLIACPATVLHQWVKEFQKWSPEFRVAILHETGSYNGRKEALIKHIVKDKGILVTSYSNIRIHQDELLRYRWDYVILDEGHKIRNPDAEITLACKQFATPHRLILSGSPLQNNLKELWSLFDFIYPGKLGTLPVFMAEFSVPITAGGYANASDVQVQTSYKCACVLRDTISPYLLRRLKKDVNMSLNLPTKNEQVLFCRLTQEQRDLYKKYINSRDVVSILAGKMKIFPGLIMLRKICNHPDLSSAAGSLDWMKAKQSAESSANPDEKTEFDNGYGFWKRSGKMIVVESLLRLWKEQNHKVLLFSQTKQMLDIMESFVKEESYTYLRMDGSTSIGSRQPTIEKFNQDKSIFLFLLTTRVGGLGVNLVGANRVIIFDPDWNPSTDTQARERSWRIGQDKHVTIYRLLTTGTIEEKIYHRQIFKQFLTNRVLKNPAQRRFFKSNDLYELFSLGDEGPRNNTETSAIFAGTGSEIKLGKKVEKTEDSTGNSSVKLSMNAKRSRARVGKPADVLQATVTKCNDDKGKTADDTIHKDPRAEARSLKRKSHSVQQDVWQIKEEDWQENEESNAKDGIDKSINRIDESKKETTSIEKIGQAISDLKEDEDEIDEISVNEAESEKRLTFAKEKASARGRNDSTADQAKIIKSKLKKKKRKRVNAKVDGQEISHLDKHAMHKQKDEEPDVKKHDEDVLMALFDQTGVHSALKHDKIEESGNPDYVLVEKEAERVAKQAAEALRKSRALCRNAEIGVPTWTGNNGEAGLATAKPAKRPRFGIKRKSSTINNTETVAAKKTVFDGSEMVEKASADSNDLSSANLLKKMRARKALSGTGEQSGLDHNQYSIHGNAYGSKEEELMKEIRYFVALRARNEGQATTQEILQEFKSKIDDRKNALFKEMLKQVCVFRKVDGQGIWFLKDPFR